MLNDAAVLTPNTGLKQTFNQVTTSRTQPPYLTSPEEAEVVGQFKNYRSSMLRQRTKTRPPLPKTLAEVDLSNELSKLTLDRRTFIIYNEGTTHRLVIYCTNEFLTYFAQSPKILLDETFKSRPKHFYQIYTIHGYFRNTQLIPFIYAFLPDKSQATYKRLFSVLLEKIAENGLQLQATTAQVDFERAAILAIESMMPAVAVKGCYFHFTQAVYRKAMKLGLHEGFEERGLVYKLVKRCCGLPLVDLQSVDAVYEQVKQGISPRQDPNHAKSILFFQYMERVWLGSNGSSGKFPIEIWNQARNLKDRTNNTVEGWHNAFNRGKIHPNIYEAVGKVQKEQKIQEDETRRIRNGGGSSATYKKKYKDMNMKLENLYQFLENGEILPIEFLHRVSTIVPLSLVVN